MLHVRKVGDRIDLGHQVPVPPIHFTDLQQNKMKNPPLLIPFQNIFNMAQKTTNETVLRSNEMREHISSAVAGGKG
jgi:hypothetical protein